MLTEDEKRFKTHYIIGKNIRDVIAKNGEDLPTLKNSWKQLFISKIMNLDVSAAILIVVVGYVVIFVVVSFFEHYKSAKKYMEEHNVSPEVAWYCTKPHSDEFEA